MDHIIARPCRIVKLAEGQCLIAASKGIAKMNNEERIAQLEKEIAELKARLPKHSVPAAMIIELEDLEEELEMQKARSGHGTD